MIEKLYANNLYGWAMSQHLPTGMYRWPTEEEVNAFDLSTWPEDGAYGFLLEVDFDCSEELHDLLVDYPPAPEKKHVSYDMLSESSASCWVRIWTTPRHGRAV